MKSIRLALASFFFAAVIVFGGFISSANAATVHVPDSMLYRAATGGINFSTDSFKCGLVTSAYTYNRSTHQFYSDITNEVVGTGYTAGGVTVVPIITNDTTNHQLTITIPAVSWTTATITARQLFCYKNTGVAGTSPLIGFSDFLSDVSSTAGTFSVGSVTINYTHF